MRISDWSSDVCSSDLELVHFWTLHAYDHYHYKGQTLPGGHLRELIREELYERVTGEHAPYNRKFVTNSVACTTDSVVAAALNSRDLDAIGPDEGEIGRARCREGVCRRLRKRRGR